MLLRVGLVEWREDCEVMFCRVIIVDDCGGVFLFKIFWGGGWWVVGLIIGVRFGLGLSFWVLDVLWDCIGVGDEGVCCFLCGCVGDVFGFGELGFFLSIKLRFWIELGCMDCMCLCFFFLISVFLGEDLLVMCFVRFGIIVVFFFVVCLLSVVWVDWIVVEVLVCDVKLGDWGLRGSGGGVCLGLELFYLLLISWC